MSSSLVSKELDQFIADKDMHYWVVTLSNGETVYEDDDRPDHEEKNAWRRLKNYCEINSIYVARVDFVFRSNRVSVDTSSWDGVFFIKSILGHIRIVKGGQPVPDKRFPSRYFYILGRLIDDKIITQRYEMPIVVHRNDDERNVGTVEKKMLIYKNG